MPASLYMLISNMRRLFQNVLIFLVAVVAADKLFGLAMGKILQETEKGDWGRNNYIFSELKSDAVILGSSRAIHHYDPKIMSDSLGMSCYNCGEDGMGVFLMYARYKAIRQRYIPRLVIYEILPEYDLLLEKDNLRYLKFLRPYTTVPAVDSIVHNISPVERYKLMSEMFRYNSVFLDIISQRYSKAPKKACDYTYSPLDGKMNYEPPKSSNDQVLTDSLKLFCLEKLITNGLSDGTRLVFTASPIYKPVSDVAFTPLKELCSNYQIPFINYYCNKDLCDNPAYFADGGHLNRSGAELVTSIIASDIKKILR